MHSQGADVLDVFSLVLSFWRLRCTSCDLSCTQQPRAHLFRVAFSTHVQQPLRCWYTRADTHKERCEQFVVNIESTIMHQIYGSGAMPMQVTIKVRRRFGPCDCCIQFYVECCGARHDTCVTQSIARLMLCNGLHFFWGGETCLCRCFW